MPSRHLAAATLAFALIGAGAAAAAPLDANHYSGTWLEVGRTPMKLTDGCGAGSTTYTRTDATHVKVVDDCWKNGKRKAVTGSGTIKDPGTDHVMDVRYFLVMNWRFEVLEHEPAGEWFIAGDLQRKPQRIFIFTRTPPSAELLASLVAKARAAGYTGVMEMPRPR